MDRDVLHKALMALIPDEKLVQFVMKLAKRPLWIDKEMFVSDKGILQGSPLSPLLCNVYFHSLDLFLEQSSIPFIRFADDLIIFSSDLSNTQANYSQVLDYLTQHLHLVPNKRKCRIAPSQELTFLGCRFKRNNKGFIICDKPDEKQEFFSQWYDSVPKNNRRRFDILSDGILRQKEFTLFFEKGDGKTEIPSRATDTINVYSNVVFDSGVLQKALSAGIQINLFSKENHLVGRIIPNKPLKSPKTTYEQLMAYYSPTQRVKLASDIILASVHNTRLNIRYYNKQYPDEGFDICLAEINRLAGLVRKESSYEKLLLLEAKTS